MVFCWGVPDKQAITGDYYKDFGNVLPALQVEQVKTGCFLHVYEDNAWKDKPNSNDQGWKNVVEFLFLLREGIFPIILTPKSPLHCMAEGTLKAFRDHLERYHRQK